ncbi:MAG: hypothetical protein KDD40_09850, partial [Bdellovibrionales bacterium]|nr:hypothetical protein [Bdellovibrionales bacterium]
MDNNSTAGFFLSLLLSFLLCLDLAIAEPKYHSNECEEVLLSSFATSKLFLVGLVKWQSPQLAAFPKKNRMDKNLAETFIEMGLSKKRIVSLFDEEATLTKLKRRLTYWLKNLKEHETFYFYFTGHGIKNDEGECYFANYDYKLGQYKTA